MRARISVGAHADMHVHAHTADVMIPTLKGLRVSGTRYGKPYSASSAYDAAQLVHTQSASLMPWQGNAEMMIDRHDVRAHMDIITSYQGEHDEDCDNEDEQEVCPTKSD